MTLIEAGATKIRPHIYFGAHPYNLLKVTNDDQFKTSMTHIKAILEWLDRPPSSDNSTSSGYRAPVAQFNEKYRQYFVKAIGDGGIDLSNE